VTRERKFRVGTVDQYAIWHKANHRTPRKRKKKIKTIGSTDPFGIAIEIAIGNMRYGSGD